MLIFRFVLETLTVWGGYMKLGNWRIRMLSIRCLVWTARVVYWNDVPEVENKIRWAQSGLQREKKIWRECHGFAVPSFEFDNTEIRHYQQNYYKRACLEGLYVCNDSKNVKYVIQRHSGEFYNTNSFWHKLSTLGFLFKVIFIFVWAQVQFYKKQSRK